MNNELGNFKIFEFVRILRVKTSEAKAIQGEVRAQSSSPSTSLNHLDLSQETLCDDDLNESETFGFPKKRSGHRAVCNNENLWIWGGYCPVDEEANNDDEEDETDPNARSPLFPEVF